MHHTCNNQKWDALEHLKQSWWCQKCLKCCFTQTTIKLSNQLRNLGIFLFKYHSLNRLSPPVAIVAAKALFWRRSLNYKLKRLSQSQSASKMLLSHKKERKRRKRRRIKVTWGHHWVMIVPMGSLILVLGQEGTRPLSFTRIIACPIKNSIQWAAKDLKASKLSIKLSW